jgi:hypothetical protein
MAWKRDSEDDAAVADVCSMTRTSQVVWEMGAEGMDWAEGAHCLASLPGFPKCRRAPMKEDAQGILDGIAGYSSVKVATQEEFNTIRKPRALPISVS